MCISKVKFINVRQSVTPITRIISNMNWITILLIGAVVVGNGSAMDNEIGVDVREGKDVTLNCRFNNPELLDKGGRIYWMRQRNGEKDNVAIDKTPFERSYTVNFQPDEGRYDLTISRATYDRDNGMFECRVKAAGTGDDLHSTSVNLTVLIPPGSPTITPQVPVATEGDNVELQCSSKGGSPDPQINWYRKGSDVKLSSVLKPGGGRDTPTTSILTLQPEKDDDGSEYRCVVWNRASENEKMEAQVQLNVNYYPRITVGPANPLKVELGGLLSMTCQADAKPPVSNVRWTRAGRFLETKNTFSKMNVEMDDAGRYICLADNGLGVTKENEITVDVLYGPRVTVISNKDVDEGENILIPCNVTASPPPVTIEWLKIGDDSFRQNGELLRLDHVTAANQGDYICRAVNILNPTGGEASDRVGNATVAVRVRHAPGKTFITPSEPIAVQEEATTLTCGANPPGWPTPTYRWWRGDSDATLTLGENYTIPRASINDEGIYYCQPSNRLGKGTPASVTVKVHQSPSILETLPESAVYQIGKTDISMTCRAQGKPLPSIRWLKDEKEISPADGLYDVVVEQASFGQNDAHTLQSRLEFRGQQRINDNQLMPQDRGTYQCVFRNDVGEVSSKQQLQVKHAPITVHKANKVAFDLRDDALMECRMQAFPAPTFEWSLNSNPISDDGMRYSTNYTKLSNDVYASILSIRGVSESDYGGYVCKGINKMGDHKTIITLGPKGPPDYPSNLHVVKIGTDFCELGWDEGFDGGIPAIFEVLTISENGIRMDHDCQNANPCKIQALEQQTTYNIKVKASNAKGESDFSEPISAKTLVNIDSIPEPFQVLYEPTGNVLSFKVLTTNLELDGFIETLPEGSSDWITLPEPIRLQRLDGSHTRVVLSTQDVEDVRVRLCSQGTSDICGKYMPAKRVDVLPVVEEPSAMSMTVAVIVGCLVFIAVLALVLLCCCCRRRNTKLKKKEAELEAEHRGVSTAPPPPYYTVGMDNKGLEGSIDNGLNANNGKQDVYAPQHYNYNTPHINNTHNTNGMGYMDNSYSNSNNGGSVNSQDSLWQVKGQTNEPVMNASDPRGYQQYDPVVHGGYGITGYDDYSHYPPQQQAHDDYGQQPNYISNGDPYAAVHKPRSHMEQMDGSYDVSGHPDPYMDHHHQQQLQQEYKPQLNFDESLESGYSTPNSRNRRVIREIIV
ncbi:unnamed protein product [Meganyctiphanes norvegica]|uniref:Uncharacterized protein n=1 Tax=Meganyctiphanes norvegica TaxID=48144 RepID=A0AAV2QIJ1_MEGNR